jgi:hypothetical protein
VTPLPGVRLGRVDRAGAGGRAPAAGTSLVGTYYYERKVEEIPAFLIVDGPFVRVLPLSDNRRCVFAKARAIGDIGGTAVLLFAELSRPSATLWIVFSLKTLSTRGIIVTAKGHQRKTLYMY